MMYKKTIAAVLAFVGVGGLAYVVQLVHAEEHTPDKLVLDAQVQKTARLESIVTRSLLRDELRRRERLREQDQTAFVREELAEVQLTIEQLQDELKDMPK